MFLLGLHLHRRLRRVGWLDLVMLRHAARINSLTELALTKMDILSGLAEVPVCVAYEHRGQRLDHFPSSLESLSACTPACAAMRSAWPSSATRWFEATHAAAW